MVPFGMHSSSGWSPVCIQSPDLAAHVALLACYPGHRLSIPVALFACYPGPRPSYTCGPVGMLTSDKPICICGLIGMLTSDKTYLNLWSCWHVIQGQRATTGRTATHTGYTLGTHFGVQKMWSRLLRIEGFWIRRVQVGAGS